MLPLTVGMLCVGPLSGYLSDRFGARPFATTGMVLAALGFGLLMLLPANFACARSFSAECRPYPRTIRPTTGAGGSALTQ